ncbi:sel1 repeat family protein [Pelomyxa schiedti]|nr:sel1 repeat family protein [Pelomyxa schiedti]
MQLRNQQQATGTDTQATQQQQSDRLLEQQREVYRHHVQMDNRGQTAGTELAPSESTTSPEPTSSAPESTSAAAAAASAPHLQQQQQQNRPRPRPLSAALGHLVWYCLVLEEPRLLEPLWPLDAYVNNKFGVAAKCHPLPMHQWMVDFLESVISQPVKLSSETKLASSTGDDSQNMETSSPTVTPTAIASGCSLKLNSLAHLLLGLALSPEYGSWPFTDESKSIEHLRTAAEGGDKMALYWLCQPYGDINLEYLRRSASQGFCLALQVLGVMYQDVESSGEVPLNREEGIRLLQIGAVEKGFAGCQFEMACSAEIGSTERLRWLKLASDQGLARAQWALARALHRSSYSADTLTHYGVTGNHQEEALRLLKLSAAQGMAESQAALGMLFMEGVGGVKQNYQTAVEYLSLASNKGYPNALFELAQCYLEGKGVEIDEAKAVTLLEQAAECGIAEAHVSIGMMYMHGTSATPKDLTQAGNRFRLAVKTNCHCEQAAYLLSNLIFRGTAQGTKREAMELLRKSTDSMRPECFVGLAEVYGHGVGGMPKDVRESVRCYRLAASSSPPSSPHGAQARQRLKTYCS